MSRFQRILRRRHLYDDLAAEIHQHIHEKTKQLSLLEAMTREKAEQAPRWPFGNPILIEQKKQGGLAIACSRIHLG
jgi:hypothetical protein